MPETVLTDPYAYAEQHAGRFVEELREACRIPSISATRDPGLQQMADWLTARLEPLLDEVCQLPVEGAAPAVVGRLQGTGPYTVLWYSHYDVQPVDPVDAWTHPPFGSEIADDRLYARGAVDDKTDITARIHALEAWLQTRGRPPFTIVWLSEGAEESGSTGLGAFLERHRERLEADACLWESNIRRADGRPELAFGLRGIASVELRLQRLLQDQHSSFAAVFRSAAAELVRGLATLTDDTGRVTIEGFHDGVIPLDADDLDALRTLEPPSTDGASLEGADPFLSADPDEVVRRLVHEPTANICGIETGHMGPGFKAVLPAQARARVDFRIVPGQTPERTVELLRAHLDRHGLADVEIELLYAFPPAKSPIDFPLGRAVTQAARERMGEPLRNPLVPGSGPMFHVVETLGLPTVAAAGCARMSSGLHAPDEHALLSDYRDQIGFLIRLIELLGEQ